MVTKRLLKKGSRHGHLEIVSLTDKEDEFVCKCDCGKVLTLDRKHFMLRKTCGCGIGILHIKHGKSRTRIYRIYIGMIGRCYNPHYNTYPNYGAQGITVCEEWRDKEHSFERFLEWSKGKYRYDLSIDRLDPYKGYSPDNCRWATGSEQTTHFKISPKHKTGYRNVYPTIYGTYQVIMSVHDKSYNVGSFKTIEAAVNARNAYIDANHLPNPKQEYLGILK